VLLGDRSWMSRLRAGSPWSGTFARWLLSGGPIVAVTSASPHDEE
jgi:hypothetical protein